eukprot:7936548-Pyramimonas_sp.AAC.1
MRKVWESLGDEIAIEETTARALSIPREERPPSVLTTPACNEHPVVRDSRAVGGPDPVPLAVYLDGVRFVSQAAGRSESVGLWVLSLVSQKRHFVCAVKSGDLCSCGCKG